MENNVSNEESQPDRRDFIKGASCVIGAAIGAVIGPVIGIPGAPIGPPANPPGIPPPIVIGGAI